MDIVLLVLVGVVSGVVAAVCGVGGGVVVVPALVLLRGTDIKVAIATSLAYIVPTAAWAVWRKPAGQVEWTVAALLAAGGIAGATLGVIVGEALPAVWVKRVFAALLVVVAVRLVVES